MESPGAAFARRPFLFGAPDAAGRRRAVWAAVAWGVFLLTLTSWPSPPEVPALTTPELTAKMGTDLFVYHGYSELRLDGRWIKATPMRSRRPPRKRAATMPRLTPITSEKMIATALRTSVTGRRLRISWVTGWLV